MAIHLKQFDLLFKLQFLQKRQRNKVKSKIFDEMLGILNRELQVSDRSHLITSGALKPEELDYNSNSWNNFFACFFFFFLHNFFHSYIL